ncbi:MAG: acyltransferase family protein, partial [Vicinamibacterales bacterium]
MAHATTYRPEIDGLRALAVLPVIGFHAGFPLFTGGFVGVDVFFVISGYLITGIILSEQQAGTFSAARFYERRARRILPALFLVLAVSSVIAWFRLLPVDLKAFAASLTGVAGFYANLIFAGETGYFETAAELKPLLHTWSLSVEEQFYLVFPLLLILTRRWRAVWRACLFLAIGAASLAAAELDAYSRAEAVFLLQTRAWAVTIGVLAAFYHQRDARPFAPATAQVMSGFGLALVALSVVTFSRATPFPGVVGLAPTVGTALILLGATPGTAVHRVLGSAPLAGLGLISYGAYLWHQPLFAFARHNVAEPPSTAVFLWLTLATLVLAYASWRWVERPFRTGTRVSRRAVAAVAVSGSALFAALGQVTVANEGFAAYYIDHRLSPEARTRYQLVRDHTGRRLPDDMVDDGACRFWTMESTGPSPDFASRFDGCAARLGPAVVVLGDSHAMNVYNLVAKANVSQFVVGFTKPGCRPQNDNPDCHYRAFGRFVEAHA